VGADRHSDRVEGVLGLALTVPTSLLGIVSVAGAFFVPTPGAAIIVPSILTTIWVVLLGYQLVWLGGNTGSDRSGTR
jgi:hypothetical protein